MGNRRASIPASRSGSRGVDLEDEDDELEAAAAANPSLSRDCSIACFDELIMTVCDGKQALEIRKQGETCLIFHS